MNTVAGSRKEKESKWPVENPEMRALSEWTLGEWIEFGHKLRSASDEEILALIGSVVTYLEDELNDELFPSPYYNYNNYTEYVRGYTKIILKAARVELRKRNLKQLR